VIDWKEGVRTFAWAMGLLTLNLAIAWRLLRTEWVQQMSSIEGAYIGLARYINAHRGDLDWMPLWYGGIPFQDSYPPALHFLVAGVARVTGLSAAHAYHATCAVVYALGAVTLYLLVRALAKSQVAALAAALAYSCVSPSAWLIPAVRRDAGGVSHARRLMTLAQYGEGPHILSLTLVPLALLAMHLLLERPSALRLAAAAIAYAAVALSNWLGSFALALGTLVLVLLHSPKHLWRWGLPACLLGYALAAPWLPPSTIRLVRQNAQMVGGDYQLTALGLTVFTVICLVAGLVTWRLRASHPATAFGAGFAILTGGITLIREWFGLVTFPQPERYHLAMEMGLAVLTGLAWSWLYRHTSRTPRIALLVVTTGAVLFQTREYREHARTMVKPIDIRETVEYQAGTWAAKNLPGERVFLAGSTGFWSTCFGDVSQFKGGFDQGQPYLNRHAANYSFTFLEGNGGVTAQWLRAYGNTAVFVTGKQTRDAYQDFRDPAKFDELLPVIWQNGDDRIYRLPTPHPSLAHVIRREEAVASGPFNWESADNVGGFVRAIDDPARPEARLIWRGQSRFDVEASIAAGEMLSLQINHHPGWQAKDQNGRTLQTSADGLGFLLVQPLMAGPARISFVFNGGREMADMKLLQGLAAGMLMGLMIRQLLRQRLN
jgi:hypothetical protein